MTERQMEAVTESTGFVPPYAIPVAPVFVWPPQLGALRAYLFGFPGYLWPFYVAFIAVALFSWLVLGPTPDQERSLSVEWIAPMILRNIMLITMIAGSLYYFLYIRRTQGSQYKYSPQWPSTGNRRFLFGSQVRENIFWSLCSAAPIWAAYESVGLWMHATGRASTVGWVDHPIYCTLLVLLLPIVAHVHFWAVHRLLHWPPLYRTVHYLHHKNVNTNSWTGLSMHPVEHLLFFSGAAFFYVLPSSPFHLVLYLHLLALATAMDHTGFHKIVLPGKREFDFDFFMHYLHHKYFEVNYAADTTFPADVWEGTFHDGTEAGMAVLRRRRRHASESR